MSLKLHSKALYLNRSYTYLVPIGQFPTLCLNYKLPNDLDMCDSHLTQHWQLSLQNGDEAPHDGPWDGEEHTNAPAFIKSHKQGSLDAKAVN